jgi:radical SAM superfamily enzyme YgiQ (UPF0313 family)
MSYDFILFSDISQPLNGKGMGAYRIANHLRDQGFSIKVIHSFIRITDDQFEKICNQYINEKTIAVGLGATVLADLDRGFFLGIHEEHARKRFTNLKQKFPWVQLIIGGAQITGASEEFISKLDFFDWAIKGQGETAIVSLLNHIKNKENIKTNTVTRPRIITDKVYSFDDFNRTFNSFTDDDEIVPGEGLPIEIARGCVFKCKFCSYELIGKKFGEYTKAGQLIRKELIENYERWGTTDYYVADETINDSIEKVQMLVDSVSGLDFKPRFGGFMRLDLIWRHPEMAQMLLDWGIEACSFGIETINDRSGSAVGKGLGINRIESTLTHLRSVWEDKVYINASFILGLKYDTIETAKELDQWLNLQFQKQHIHKAMIKPLYIMPTVGNSYLDQHYVDQGYRLLENISNNKNDPRARSAEGGQSMIWANDYWNYLQAKNVANLLHRKYNKNKMCQGRIAKHNFHFIKSILPKEYKDHLITTMIKDQPFPELSFEETESLIYKLYDEHNQRYISKILKEK